MHNSKSNTENLDLINECFSVDLKDDKKLNNCIEIIEGFICKYDTQYIQNLKYNSIVKELLKDIRENNTINNNLIEELAKRYNEDNNKYLILKEEKVKKGFLNWLLKIFKANPKKEVSIDTKDYDQEERRLVDKFNIIGKKIEDYVNEVYRLNNIITEKKFNIIISKVFNAEEITSDLIQLLDELKGYRNYVVSNKNTSVIDKTIEDEKTLDEVEVSYVNETSEEEAIIENATENLDNENVIKDTIDENSSEKEDLEINETIVDEKVTTNEEVEENAEEDIDSKILIEEVFNENIFKIFLNYCDENNIKTLNELKDFDFSELDKLKGFGAGKKEKLIKKYTEVMGNDYIEKVKKERIESKIEEVRIRDCYKSLDIAILECFNKINGKLIEQLKNNNINNVEELYLEVHNNILSIPNLGATKIKYIKDALESLTKEPEELFRGLIDEIKANTDYDILVKRVINNKTLQQIGEGYGVSRERIRQREKKIVKAVEAVLSIFIGIVDIKDVKLASMEEILGISILDEEENKCLKDVLINADNIECEYLVEVDKFLVNGDVEELRSKIKSIANGMPDIVNIKSELIYDLQEYTELNILSLDEVVRIILTLGYKQVNDYLFRGNVSKTKIYNFIVKEFFKDGITFSNEADINKFMSILNEKFHIEEETIRNIKAKIETSCVLCDRGSYIHPEWVYIDENLLEEVKEYIDNNDQETLYINQIFSEFEEELNKVGVKNRYYLQGILKYYFSDKYNFTKDTLYKGNIKHDRNYLFNKYIKDKGRPVTKEDIENDLKGWTPIMLIMAEDECKYVLKWDRGGFIHASLVKASLEDISGISEVLKEAFNNKESLTDNEAFDMLNVEFKEFFSNNNIDSSFKLFSILEYLLSKEYYFRRPYILKDKPKESVSAVYLMKKLFNNDSKVTLEQLKEFCNDIKLNDSTRMQSINNLLKDTVEIEKETYILKDNFEVDEAVVEAVKKIILEKINDNEYIALKSIIDYSVFPNIKYEWNTYILRDICEYYIPEVKELKRQFYDKRYPAPVIVKESSEMNELLDLIINILKSEFENGIGVNELSKVLRDNNIVYDKIPFEIYNCDEIVVEDNFIRLK